MAIPSTRSRPALCPSPQSQDIATLSTWPTTGSMPAQMALLMLAISGSQYILTQVDMRFSEGRRHGTCKHPSQSRMAGSSRSAESSIEELGGVHSLDEA
mmetsp:Transcript_22552/g.52516  ORF Transcript_22552/g.52516 Transcript_22552/m.52516 type:complete len:99 (-) Transcript_22552:38-334(-)